MTDNHLYSKPDSGKEPKSESGKTSEVILPKLSADIINMYVPVGYTKTDGEKELVTFLVIFSGGEVRERDYFHIINRNQDKFTKIKIRFLDRSETQIDNDDPKLAIKEKEGGFSPDKLWIFAQHWLKERYIKGENNENIEPIDRIYLISDIDHFMEEILRIKPLCESARIKLILSNSCFEKWLYYGHYLERPDMNPTKFICPDEITKISSKFKEYANTVVKGGFNSRQAIFQIETAIANARINYEEDENRIPLLYSTNMFILGEELLSLVEPELNRLKEENELRAETYRKNKNSQMSCPNH